MSASAKNAPLAAAHNDADETPDGGSWPPPGRHTLARFGRFLGRKERAVRDEFDRLGVPYTKFASARLYDSEEAWRCVCEFSRVSPAPKT